MIYSCQEVDATYDFDSNFTDGFLHLLPRICAQPIGFRRETMLRFPVSNQKQAELNERMRCLALVEGEIEESFFKASSPGGQKANKTLSGVSLLHLPTQIRIRCQRERSQGINRFIARRLLVEEMEARQRGMTRHSAKAERLHEEKERKNRSSKKQPSATGQATTRGHQPTESKPGVFDLARAMGAYYLRPLIR